MNSAYKALSTARIARDEKIRGQGIKIFDRRRCWLAADWFGDNAAFVLADVPAS